MYRSTVTFADTAVAVEADGLRATGLVKFVVGSLPAGSARPALTLRLIEADQGRFSLFQDDALVYEDDACGVTAAVLADQLSRRVAERARHGLLLHAAAVSRQGRGILLPGPSGAGKSTLTGWLTRGCCDYLTDDLAFVPHGTGRLEGFARPLKVDDVSWAVLAPRLAGLSGEDVLRALGTRLVRPHALGSLPDRVVSDVALILFARYDPSGNGRLSPMTGGRTGLELMGALVNAPNLSGHGFDAAVALARSTRAYSIRYRHCDEVETALRSWFGRLPLGRP